MTGDLHGTESTTMWMSTGVLPNWIQYEFDAVYKLDKLLVWNSNQVIEAFIGFGAKDVTVEYSVDGATWTTLADVPQFVKGDRHAGLRGQQHRQFRWRGGQIRQADDQQELVRRRDADRSGGGAVLLRPGPGPRAAAGRWRHRRQRRWRPELAARPRGDLAPGLLRHGQQCPAGGRRPWPITATRRVP